MWCAGFSLWLLIAEHGLQGMGFSPSVVAAQGLSCCSSPALEHRLSSCGTQGFAALRHMGSSWIRDGTHISCIGRRTLSLSRGNYHYQGNLAIFFLRLQFYFFSPGIPCRSNLDKHDKQPVLPGKDLNSGAKNKLTLQLSFKMKSIEFWKRSA